MKPLRCQSTGTFIADLWRWTLHVVAILAILYLPRILRSPFLESWFSPRSFEFELRCAVIIGTLGPILRHYRATKFLSNALYFLVAYLVLQEQVMLYKFGISYEAVYFSDLNLDSAIVYVRLNYPWFLAGVFIAILCGKLCNATASRVTFHRISLFVISAIAIPSTWWVSRRPELFYQDASLHFFQEGYRFYFAQDESHVTFTEQEVAAARELGILTDVPRPSDPGNRQNVIMIFLESFQRNFLSLYNEDLPGITPELDRFANESLDMRNFVNSSFPTVNSLISSQCAQPVYVGREIRTTDSFPRVCLPDLLEDSGYDLAYLGASRVEQARGDIFLASKGFRELLDSNYYLARDNRYEKKSNYWGLYDPDFSVEIADFLKARTSPRPLYLVAAYVGTHWPGFPDPACPVYDEADEYLNAIHCADFAVGKILQYLRESGLFDRSVILILGDHMLPEAPRQMRSRQLFAGHFGKVFAALHLPGRRPLREESVSYTADIPPTILESLNMGPTEMLAGKSILSARKKKPFLFGKTWRGDADGIKFAPCRAPDLLASISLTVGTPPSFISPCQREKMFKLLDRFLILR